MRIEQLQAFLSVAETGNFGQAARQCNVTQSTVSRQIQALETELGLSLFHRSSIAKLTVGGEKFLPHARKICQEWQKATAECQELLLGKQPELCVAAIHSVCANYLPPVLQQFCQDYPSVQLRVTALGSDRALKVLRDNLVDVALVMNNKLLTVSPELIVIPLYEEPIQVLIAANHPLSQYETVPWSDLTKYSQVVFKDGYGMQRLVQECFAHLDKQVNIALELNTLDAFRGVIKQGQMVALLPQGALIDASKDPQLTIRQLAPLTTDASSHMLPAGKKSMYRQVVLVTTKERLHIPPIAHFCQLVEQLIIPARNLACSLTQPVKTDEYLQSSAS